MKKNFPVTGQEKSIPEGVRLVSRTDTKGIITFANDNFVSVCGFTRDELVGTSHNIVRHPDVPPVVFEDMWDTLKKGLPWRGVVKNRCKSGDHYWVDAHVVPVRKDGATIGYMSVRTRPSREAIAQAEALYAEAARTGRIPRQSGGGWRRFMSVRNGAALGIVFVTLMMIAGGILGITGLATSSSAMRSLYYEEMAPVQAIGRINFLMADNRAQVALALRERGSDAPQAKIATHMAALGKNKEEIDSLWSGYQKRARSMQERELADRYWVARNRYVEGGLFPARRALEKGNFEEADKVMTGSINPLYDEANRRAVDLLTFLSARAQGNFARVADRNELISIVAVAGITAGCLIVLFAGVYFFRATVLPLQSAVVALERIGEGNLSGENDTSGYGEPGRVMTGVTMMQLHLKVMMDEIRQWSGSIREQCQRLNETMMNLAQHSEEQHDRVYQTVDAATLSCEGLNRLADDAEAMMQLAERMEGHVGLGPLAHETGAEAAVPHAGGGDPRLEQMAHDLAAAVRIEAFSMGDTVSQMNQVAMLIVENRGDVQGAWAASQKLEKTANELEKLVKYFD
ncbi:PAS domain S-box protein [Herbaspirillum sp. HC18]|nr:PAS domain S-box protein [Herbaspirillum sp. HC18]